MISNNCRALYWQLLLVFLLPLVLARRPNRPWGITNSPVEKGVSNSQKLPQVIPKSNKSAKRKKIIKKRKRILNPDDVDDDAVVKTSVVDVDNEHVVVTTGSSKRINLRKRKKRRKVLDDDDDDKIEKPTPTRSILPVKGSRSSSPTITRRNVPKSKLIKKRKMKQQHKPKLVELQTVMEKEAAAVQSEIVQKRKTLAAPVPNFPPVATARRTAKKVVLKKKKIIKKKRKRKLEGINRKIMKDEPTESNEVSDTVPDMTKEAVLDSTEPTRSKLVIEKKKKDTDSAIDKNDTSVQVDILMDQMGSLALGEETKEKAAAPSANEPELVSVDTAMPKVEIILDENDSISIDTTNIADSDATLTLDVQSNVSSVSDIHVLDQSATVSLSFSPVSVEQDVIVTGVEESRVTLDGQVLNAVASQSQEADEPDKDGLRSDSGKSEVSTPKILENEVERVNAELKSEEDSDRIGAEINVIPNSDVTSLTEAEGEDSVEQSESLEQLSYIGDIIPDIRSMVMVDSAKDASGPEGSENSKIDTEETGTPKLDANVTFSIQCAESVGSEISENRNNEEQELGTGELVYSGNQLDTQQEAQMNNDISSDFDEEDKEISTTSDGSKATQRNTIVSIEEAFPTTKDDSETIEKNDVSETSSESEEDDDDEESLLQEKSDMATEEFKNETVFVDIDDENKYEGIENNADKDDNEFGNATSVRIAKSETTDGVEGYEITEKSEDKNSVIDDSSLPNVAIDDVDSSLSLSSEAEDKSSSHEPYSRGSKSQEEEVERSEETEPSSVLVSPEKLHGVVAKFDLQNLAESKDSPNDITVAAVTWNLAEESPVEEDATFIRKIGKAGHDLVLISGQECENIKPRRTEGSRSREFRRLMIKMLGKDYVPLALHLLGGIQFGLFCKRSILSEIEQASIADVTCGIGNVFHNKGAIGCFLQMKARECLDKEKSTKSRAKSVKMLFVTAHMAAHVKNAEARDNDFWRIVTELEAQAPPRFLHPKRAGKETTGSYLLNSVDRIFFCGDLNYRIDLPREEVEHSVSQIKDLLESHDNQKLERAEEIRHNLLRHDQLRTSIAMQRAFPGFAEGKISFAPTFKFDKGTDEYDTSHKQRIPAYTDRVLYKPVGTRVLEYDSIESAQHSDHRPVYATFRVNMEGKELPAESTKRRKRQRTEF